MIEDCINQHILLIVAHQDDEVLYFGGLLSCIYTKCKNLKIVSITSPAPNRKDTNTRIDSFKQVCKLLKCHYSLGGFQDSPPDTKPSIVYTNLPQIADFIKKEIIQFSPNIILTHNLLGEPNPIYNKGHPMHKITRNAVNTALLSLNYTGRLISTAIGENSNNYTISYDKTEKKKLFDCYLPFWSPSIYAFAYNNEVYKE